LKDAAGYLLPNLHESHDINCPQLLAGEIVGDVRLLDRSIEIFKEIEMGELFAPGHLLILLVVAPIWLAVFIVPFWQIFKKAGLGGPLSLLMIIPLVNLGMLYVLAFSKWKVVPSSYESTEI
jgi:hypothetical protein